MPWRLNEKNNKKMKIGARLWDARKYGIQILITLFISKSTGTRRDQMDGVMGQRPGRWNKVSQHGVQ